jgi:peptidoglycan/LPS O-acetylase OafA/YrhL
MNYRLAIRGTDYLSSQTTPSPFQHFCSLGVEEQFYLLWPLVLVLAALVIGLLRKNFPRHGDGRTIGERGTRNVIVALLLAIVVGSLSFSIWQTQKSAPWAYFGTLSRVWELGTGALIAMTVQWWMRLPRRLAVASRWTCLAAIAASALLYNDQTLFPGFAAVLPVLGAAAVIAAGCTVPSVVLGVGPFRLVGALSYSWYLWHWPMLMILPAVLGERTNATQGLILSGWAFVLAGVTYLFVENPGRTSALLRSDPVQGIAFGVLMPLATVALVFIVGAVFPPATAGHGQAADTASRLQSTSTINIDLARMIRTSVVTEDVPANLLPAVRDAKGDMPVSTRDGCHLGLPGVASKVPCVYGDTTSATTVVLFGDSHAEHWFPALLRIATDRHWKLVNLSKDACPVPQVTVYSTFFKRAYDECVEWRKRAFQRIRDLRPELVVLASRGDGTQSDWRQWQAPIENILTPGAGAFGT